MLVNNNKRPLRRPSIDRVTVHAKGKLRIVRLLNTKLPRVIKARLIVIMNSFAEKGGGLGDKARTNN